MSCLTFLGVSPQNVVPSVYYAPLSGFGREYWRASGGTARLREIPGEPGGCSRECILRFTSVLLRRVHPQGGASRGDV